MNVCRPLVPQFGLSCPGGSAACRAIRNQTTLQQELGLGFADVSLTVVDTSHGSRAQLKYLRGSPCPADKSEDLSMVIEFYCDPKAGRGTPILQKILHDCHYAFDWATNVICPVHNCEVRKDKCEVFNKEMNLVLDLKKVVPDGILKVSLKINFQFN